ncbi:hypothetical protein POVWA2_003860 [Plasmodium ovale wallikeri]|uniref:Nucleoside transporter 4 n=1 Tax=Plasmodium ovale wallikeri TaxID=864142 RepID=A0A1A8YGV2_PLAOA|nr:hypothetical protein POVWA1_003720 [Plasmodium ovale wallikeri]SBT31384.1 hypothetical protein POVWA2_003860 [Plasmodium ovale wallikeri]
MGIVSGSMIISSLFQLTFEKTSFKSIMICYLYSACTKYSLLLRIKVNGYMVTGISFSALFFFSINLLMSYFTIEDGNIQSYYKSISLSVCTIIFLELLIILYIFYIQLNSPFFLEEQRKIESQMCTSDNNRNNNDHDNINTEKLSEIEIGKSKNVNNNDSDIDQHAFSLLTIFKKKFSSFKNMFNCTNIFHGARLVKYYYVCLIPISFSIFISSIAYPHMSEFFSPWGSSPWGSSPCASSPCASSPCASSPCASPFPFPHILVTVYHTAFNFFKQKYVAVLCISRVILLGLSFTIKNQKDGDFMYSNAFISLVIFLLGSTNGSLINISYARIGDCFEESNKKEKKIAVSSSFCALCLLMSFAMAPWFCKMIIDL